jgi:hypothetical protein
MCRQSITVPEELANELVDCPECKGIIDVVAARHPDSTHPENPSSALRYDRRSFDGLVNALAELSTYAALNDWNQRAKEEQDRINRTLDSITEELRPSAQEIAKLSRELDTAKWQFKQQPVLKRMFGKHDSEKVIAAQITAIQQGTTSLCAEKAQLLTISGKLNQLMEYVAEFGPKTGEEKRLLLKKLHQQKKELQARKREAAVAMTAVRQEARTQSANAGKRGFLGATGSFNDGSSSFGWYDPEVAASQRRSIRCAKESALRPYESTKAEIEQQLISLEKRLLWVEQFE